MFGKCRHSNFKGNVRCNASNAYFIVCYHSTNLVLLLRRTVRLGGIPVVHSVPGVLQWPAGRAVQCPAPSQQTEVSTQSSISGDTWPGWGMTPCKP